jgi:hypothetical protein
MPAQHLHGSNQHAKNSQPDQGRKYPTGASYKKTPPRLSSQKALGVQVATNGKEDVDSDAAGVSAKNRRFRDPNQRESVRPKDHESGDQPQQIEGTKPMLDGRS